MPEFYVSVQSRSHALVATIESHRVTERESAVIESVLTAPPNSAFSRILIDLSNVSLLSSAGLGMLVTLQQSVVARGGQVLVCGLKDDIKKILKVTGLLKTLKIVKDLDTGLKRLS